jgi:hypothetical protein
MRPATDRSGRSTGRPARSTARSCFGPEPLRKGVDQGGCRTGCTASAALRRHPARPMLCHMPPLFPVPR